MKNNYFIGIMYIMVKTRSGRETKRVEPKKVVKKSTWKIAPSKQKMYKGSKFRRGVNKGVEDVENIGYATARGVKGVGYAGVKAAEDIGYAGVKAAEDVGYAGVKAAEDVGYAGIRGIKGIEQGVESGLTGLERGLRGLSFKNVEDEMSDLQKRITKLGGARTKRRGYKKRARSMKKR
jgi:hypothetical protein